MAIVYVLVQVLATAVPLLLAVAFATLVERRIMGAMQRRQGPFWGSSTIRRCFEVDS